MESGVEPYQRKDLLPLLRENHPLQMLAIAVATNDLATCMQNATLVYFCPVSYTHLDVYKRQQVELVDGLEPPTC